MTEEQPSRPASEALANAVESPGERPARGREVEREREGDADGRPPGPASRVVPLGLLVAVGLAILAWATLGAQYMIPVALITAILLGFWAFHLSLGRAKTRQYGDQGQDAAASDGDDPIPHLGFDTESELGATSEEPGDYQPSKSTGAR